jgi:hypothetical protein
MPSRVADKLLSLVAWSVTKAFVDEAHRLQEVCLYYRGQAEGDGVRSPDKLCCYSSKKRMGAQDTDPVLEKRIRDTLQHSEVQSN